jgi:hypothetical protein
MSDRPDKYDKQQNSEYPFLPHLTFSLLTMEVFGFIRARRSSVFYAVMSRFVGKAVVRREKVVRI